MQNKIKNLNKEIRKIYSVPRLRSPDIFKKHPDYCFTPQEPMSGDENKKYS